MHLNSRLRVTRTEDLGFSNQIRLTFAGRLNPFRLAEMYATIPSVVESDLWYIPGDSPGIYVGFQRGTE